MKTSLRRKYPYFLIGLGIVLYILGLIVLPDRVILQGNLATGEITKTLPTVLSLLFPLILTVGLNIAQIVRSMRREGYMFMYLSFLGFLFYVVIFALNI